MHVDTMGLVKGFSTEDKQPKSDHAPITITMDAGHDRRQKGTIQVKPTYRVREERLLCRTISALLA